MCVRQDAVAGPGDSLEAFARLTLYAVIARSRFNSYSLILVVSDHHFELFNPFLNWFWPTLCPLCFLLMWLVYVPFGTGLCLCLCLLSAAFAAAPAVALLCVMLSDSLFGTFSHNYISDSSDVNW